MKPSKWMKWKIGMIGTIGLAFLFHEVKISAAFDKASTEATTEKTTDASTLNDPVMGEFNSSVNEQRDDFNNQDSLPNRSEMNNNGRLLTKTGRS
jgi:hypothetical protein